MTEIEEEALKIAIKQVASSSVDEGVRTAVWLMRTAHKSNPQLTVEQIATMIESSLSTLPQ